MILYMDDTPIPKLAIEVEVIKIIGLQVVYVQTYNCSKTLLVLHQVTRYKSYQIICKCKTRKHTHPRPMY